MELSVACYTEGFSNDHRYHHHGAQLGYHDHHDEIIWKSKKWKWKIPSFPPIHSFVSFPFLFRTWPGLGVQTKLGVVKILLKCSGEDEDEED